MRAVYEAYTKVGVCSMYAVYEAYTEVGVGCI